MLRLSRPFAARSRLFSSIHPPPNSPKPTASEQPIIVDVPNDGPKDPESSDSPGATQPIADRRLQSAQILQEWMGPATAAFNNYTECFTLRAKERFSQLGPQLNKVTGYEEIEALKKKVVDQENRINEARTAAREAKTTHEQALVQRSKSQKEVNDLLSRKSTWTDGDVSRFTTLVRQDHLYEQEEHRAKLAVEELESAVEREFSELMRTILARYHEEQVWSDKIRSASTYGSLAVLGLNLLVFIMAILVVEPWKRKRLAQTFEKKVEQLSQETSTLVDDRFSKVEALLRTQTALLSESLAPQPSPLPEVKPEPEPEPTLKPEALSRKHLDAILDAVVGQPEVQTALAASIVAAGSIGWILRTWFDR
ncbi:hypothetical protein ONZ45_g298 [Pleurotus djamor]|nr:hypothetical protein ONZ45_g298 [Pleurotus djamor]